MQVKELKIEVQVIGMGKSWIFSVGKLGYQVDLQVSFVVVCKFSDVCFWIEWVLGVLGQMNLIQLKVQDVLLVMKVDFVVVQVIIGKLIVDLVMQLVNVIVGFDFKICCYVVLIFDMLGCKVNVEVVVKVFVVDFLQWVLKVLLIEWFVQYIVVELSKYVEFGNKLMCGVIVKFDGLDCVGLFGLLQVVNFYWVKFEGIVFDDKIFKGVFESLSYQFDQFV